MAYARTSAGPAGRPGACISQLGARSYTELPSLATSYLKIVHWSILLRGNDGHVIARNANGHSYLPKMRFAFWTAMDLAAYLIWKSIIWSSFK